MPEYKLTYFNAKGRAELIRLIFAYGDIPYTDERIERADWPARKATIPSGKVPMLEIDGRPLVQSLAIARYAAKEAGLVPQDNVDAAYCDALADTFADIMSEVYKVTFSSASPEEKKQKFVDEVFPTHVKPVLERLTKRLDGRPWFITDKTTWADLCMAYVLDVLRGNHSWLLKSHPVVEAHVNKVLAIPRIKAWINKRPETKM